MRVSILGTPMQVDTLWSCLVVQAATTNAAELGLTWLQAACTDTSTTGSHDAMIAAPYSTAFALGASATVNTSATSADVTVALSPALREYLFR